MFSPRVVSPKQNKLAAENKKMFEQTFIPASKATVNHKKKNARDEKE